MHYKKRLMIPKGKIVIRSRKSQKIVTIRKRIIEQTTIYKTLSSNANRIKTGVNAGAPEGWQFLLDYKYCNVEIKGRDNQ